MLVLIILINTLYTSFNKDICNKDNPKTEGIVGMETETGEGEGEGEGEGKREGAKG